MKDWKRMTFKATKAESHKTKSKALAYTKIKIFKTWIVYIAGNISLQTT